MSYIKAGSLEPKRNKKKRNHLHLVRLVNRLRLQFGGSKHQGSKSMKQLEQYKK